MSDKKRSPEQIKRRQEIIAELKSRLYDANAHNVRGDSLNEVWYWFKEYKSIAQTAMRLLDKEETK